MDEGEDLEEQPLVRNRSRRLPLGSSESTRSVEAIEESTPPITGQQDDINLRQHNANSFPSDEV